MRLSLAMIVKDEARHLPHCLASVRGLVDEIVVLDTGSTDGTPELARAEGARVEPFVWVGDFSAARNASLRHCTGDWILVLDADEAIDRRDHRTLREALEVPGVEAYFLEIREYFRSGAFIGLGRTLQANEGGYAEGREFGHLLRFQAVRLFRAQTGPVFRGRVHELAEQCFEGRGPIPTLGVAIHHFGKTEPQRDQAKQIEYTRLALEEVDRFPEDPLAHYNVIQQALQVENWGAVLRSAQAYLRLQARVPALVYFGAARALAELGRPEEGLGYLDGMLRQEPRNPVALLGKGECLEALRRLEEAQASYLEALEADPRFTLPFRNLARLLNRQGHPERARQVLEAGLDQNPLDEVLWGELVGQAAQNWPERAAADAWDALQAVPDGGLGIWHQLVIATLLAKGDRVEASEVLRRGLLAFPGHAELERFRDRVRESD